MRYLLILLILLILLTGCTTGMEYAGRTEIELENHVWLDEHGKPWGEGLRLKVDSGKEYGNIDAVFEKRADGSILMAVGSEGVKAFQGQAIAGDVKKKQMDVISDTISETVRKGIQAAKPGL